MIRIRPAALVAALVLLPLALPSCSQEREEATVDNAYIRLPVIPGRPGAAYFTLRGGRDPLTLHGIESPQVERIELHESVMSGGTMRMEALKEIALPSQGTVSFEPGGRHAMLFGIDPSLKPGDLIKLTLKLKPPVEITTEAVVRGPVDASGD